MALATKGANCFSSGSDGYSVFRPADIHIFPEAFDLVFKLSAEVSYWKRALDFLTEYVKEVAFIHPLVLMPGFHYTINI